MKWVIVTQWVILNLVRESPTWLKLSQQVSEEGGRGGRSSDISDIMKLYDSYEIMYIKEGARAEIA